MQFQSTITSRNCGTRMMRCFARNSCEPAAARLWSRVRLNSSSSPRTPACLRTVASGQTEATFRFEGASRDEINPADIFTFANATDAYPQRIVYRHGGEGWLYAQVEGSINGAPRNVTYPMRHVDCESGEVLHK